MVGASCTLNISFKHTTGARQSSRFIVQFLYRCLFYKRCQGVSAGLQYALVYQPSDDILWTEMTDLRLRNSFTQQPSDNCWPHKNDNQQRSWELVLAQVLTAQLSLTTIPCQEHIKICVIPNRKNQGVILCSSQLQSYSWWQNAHESKALKRRGNQSIGYPSGLDIYYFGEAKSTKKV
jgi:hypothetical protein